MNRSRIVQALMDELDEAAALITERVNAAPSAQKLSVAMSDIGAAIDHAKALSEAIRIVNAPTDLDGRNVDGQ